MGEVSSTPTGLAGELLTAATALEVLDALEPAAVPDVFPVPLLAVDLDRSRPDDLRKLAAGRPLLVLVGVGDPSRPTRPDGAGALDVLLPEVAEVAEAGPGLAELITAVRRNPIAAVTLCGLLRLSAGQPALDALVAESLAYSTLLAGPEFARWQATSPTRTYRPSPKPLVVKREGGRLRLLINRPEVRNAYDTATRDALVAALRAARADPGVNDIHLEAVGAAFGAGGDLGQFGTTPDPATAHLIRIGCAAGAEIVRGGPPVTAHLHGACVGAGIEVPAFAARVVATPDAFAALPELGMGLVPGAGGTVSITRRMGRRRTAWLVLSGARLPAVTAQRWGLVDEIVEQVPIG